MSGTRVEMEDEYIEAVKDCTTPATVKGFERFLGFAKGIYCSLCPDCPTIVQCHQKEAFLYWDRSNGLLLKPSGKLSLHPQS